MSIYFTPPDDVNPITRATSAKINEVIQSVGDGFDELPEDITAKNTAQDLAHDTLETEVEAARDGEATLLAKETAQDTAHTTLSDEVIAARDGEASLLAKQNDQDIKIAAATQIATTGYPDQTDKENYFLLSDGSLPFWYRLSIGGVSTTPSTTVTLTAKDAMLQNITPSVDGVEIKLPVTTTMSTGLAFVITNDSPLYYLFITDSDGVGVKKLFCRESAQIFLTTGGGWVVVESSFRRCGGIQGVVDDAIEFDTQASSYIDAVALSSTRAIVTNGIPGRVYIVDYSTGAVVVGEMDYSPGNDGATCSVDTLDSNTAIICSDDQPLSKLVAGIADCTTNDVDVISASKVDVESAAVNYVSVVARSATKATVCYQDSSTYFAARNLTYTSNPIVASAKDLYAAATTYISTAKIDADNILSCFSQASKGQLLVLDCSGAAPAIGSMVEFSAVNDVAHTSCAMLTATIGVVCFADVGDSSKGKVCLLDFSTSTMVPGTAVTFEAGATTYTDVKRLSDTLAMVTYADGGDSGKGKYCILDLSTGTIIPETPATFEAGATKFTSVAPLDESTAMVFFQDDADADYMKVRGVK